MDWRNVLPAVFWRDICAVMAWFAVLTNYAIRLFFYASAAFATKLVMVGFAMDFTTMLLLFIRFKRVRFVHLKSMNARQGSRHFGEPFSVSQSGHGA